MLIHFTLTSRSNWPEALELAAGGYNEDDRVSVRTAFLRMAWLDNAKIRRSKLEGPGSKRGADQRAGLQSKQRAAVNRTGRQSTRPEWTCEPRRPSTTTPRPGLRPTMLVACPWGRLYAHVLCAQWRP